MTEDVTPDENLAAQWQDSAPDMDYDEWLVAEIGIQEELLEDYADDPIGFEGGQAYIHAIKAEISRRGNALIDELAFVRNPDGEWVQFDTGRVLSFDECEALGLDGTGRT